MEDMKAEGHLKSEDNISFNDISENYVQSNESMGQDLNTVVCHSFFFVFVCSVIYDPQPTMLVKFHHVL